MSLQLHPVTQDCSLDRAYTSLAAQCGRIKTNAERRLFIRGTGTGSRSIAIAQWVDGLWLDVWLSCHSGTTGAQVLGSAQYTLTPAKKGPAGGQSMQHLWGAMDLNRAALTASPLCTQPSLAPALTGGQVGEGRHGARLPGNLQAGHHFAGSAGVCHLRQPCARGQGGCWGQVLFAEHDAPDQG